MPAKKLGMAKNFLGASGTGNLFSASDSSYCWSGLWRYSSLSRPSFLTLSAKTSSKCWRGPGFDRSYDSLSSDFDPEPSLKYSPADTRETVLRCDRFSISASLYSVLKCDFIRGLFLNAPLADPNEYRDATDSWSLSYAYNRVAVLLWKFTLNCWSFWLSLLEW